MKYPPECPTCGTDMVALVTSWFCPKNCDQFPGIVVIRKHKLDLGDGWVLWTDDEPPPFGWTWAKLVKRDHSYEDNHARKQWKAWAEATGWYASYFNAQANCVMKGYGNKIRAYQDCEGFAYLCP